MVELDVHGLTTNEALVKVQRFIVEASKKNIKEFDLVHGFSHGEVLKKYFSKVSNYHSSKVKSVSPSFFNPGVTHVYLY